MTKPADRAEDLYILVIAGGRGTRFWPLSRQHLPKQCLPLAGEHTLIQQTIARVLPMVPAERVLVVTAAPVEQAIREQLPMLPPENILVEPQGRNTAPAVGWGASEVARRTHGRSAVMAVLPSDHLISDEEEFRDAILDCVQAARSTNALVTLGVEPTRPETGFGYLEVGGELGNWGDRPFLRVKRFVEKPDLALAQTYLDGGQHLWNAGMFVFTVEAIRDAFRNYLPATWAQLERLRHSPDRLQEIYPQLESISLDYGIMERASSLLTVRVKFGWSDLGSWAAVDSLQHDTTGHVVAVNAQANHVHAPGKLVALVGVQDLVIIDTGDALLVCPKDQAQRVRELISAIEQRGLTDYL